jgi:hypothetical protein
MQLDPGEKDILDSVQKGEWRSIRGLNAERQRYSSYAAATFRISGRDQDALLPDADIEPDS